MLEIIEYKGKSYPKLQSEGFAAQYAFQFAKKIIGEGKTGYDIGCNREEWSYKGSLMIDPILSNEYDAMNLPNIKVDYIISSHCAEHLEDWKVAIKYWLTKLHNGGVIFLYLPNCDYQAYWAYGNIKHKHYLSPSILKGFCQFLESECLISKYFVTQGYDLNASFYCVIEK